MAPLAQTGPLAYPEPASWVPYAALQGGMRVSSRSTRPQGATSVPTRRDFAPVLGGCQWKGALGPGTANEIANERLTTGCYGAARRGLYLRYLKKRGVFYVCWTEGGRSRERSTGTSDVHEAQRALSDLIQEQGRPLGGPRDPADFPILDALADYGQEHAVDTATPERIGYAIDALTAFWEGRMVADITEQTSRAYARQRARAIGTVRRELGALRAAINHEVRQGRLTRSTHVWLPPKPEGKDRWLTRDEAAALLRATRRDPRCRLYLPLFCLIGLYTGARKEAILSLRWCQVDLERARIEFNRPGRQQSKKRRPIIPIPRGLLLFLRQARLRGGELGYVINLHGYRIANIKRSFATAAIKGGLRESVLDSDGKPTVNENGQPVYRATVTPHTLRHTAGTWMAQRAVPMWEIAGFLGHSHERTAESYSHHSPDYLARARAALD